jgi:hypothetical protein
MHFAVQRPWLKVRASPALIPRSGETSRFLRAIFLTQAVHKPSPLSRLRNAESQPLGQARASVHPQTEQVLMTFLVIYSFY